MVDGTKLLHMFLAACIERPQNAELIAELHKLILGVLHFNKCFQGNPVPYHEITQFIYNYEEDIRIDDLNLIMEAIELKIESDNMPKALELFRKLKTHISLAAAQRYYIEKVYQEALKTANNAKLMASEAQSAAKKANEISKEVKQSLIIANQTIQHAQEGANKALSISTKADAALNRAKLVAQKAEDTAQHAKRLATEADAQAKSTIANYISILGIFASIIFTLFGGVNLIGATVKLLEANSRWPYLTFIIALLMICLLTLLNMMIKWVGSMNDLKGALDRIKSGVAVQEVGSPKELNFWEKYIGFGFYTRAVLILSIVLGISMVGMYKVNKENTFSYSTEKTQKNIAKPDEPTKSKSVEKPDQGSNSNSNLETTVVEKITISNKPNSESKDDDKKD